MFDLSVVRLEVTTLYQLWIKEKEWMKLTEPPPGVGIGLGEEESYCTKSLVCEAVGQNGAA